MIKLITAGLICGILWEFWNFWALTKWIYTVPFFEDLKLFEMPLAGFFGFPPFTVECYVMINTVSILRQGRSWQTPAKPTAQPKLFPALLLGIAFFGAGIRQLWQSLAHLSQPVLALGLLAATAAGLIHGLIDASYGLPDLMIVWVLIFYLLTSRPCSSEMESSIKRATTDRSVSSVAKGTLPRCK